MSENNAKKGFISVESQNIFPIIKKWLYSEKEIFLREIVSNASDAITKYKRLLSLGEIKSDEDCDYQIKITLDKENHTLTVRDNGIGMNSSEIEKYICQIALSGALEFIQKYENTADDGASVGIIGHFGLGFYSSFMVSDTVEVISKSFDGTPAVKWTGNADGEYETELLDGEYQRGTEVIMHITDDEAEFLDEMRIRSILNKYCAFMPYPIYFEAVGENEDAAKENSPVNDTHPLWQKPSTEVTDEEYSEFYKKLFLDFEEPLLCVHINADYPLNFKGILYLPHIKNDFERYEPQIKLYYNQVFVADNIKEVIPPFLFTLKGVLDCPELPLNVSRSYLQNSEYATKISAHIAKKTADKINSLFLNEREKFEKIYPEIKPFLEYGAMSDKKFYDRIKGSLLFTTADGKFESVKDSLIGEGEKTLYYATDAISQSQYIELFKKQGKTVILLDKMLDTQFITFLERENSSLKFMRVDADVSALSTDGEALESEEMTNAFKAAAENENMKITFALLSDKETPCLININEEMRRTNEMMRFYGMDVSKNVESELVVNMENEVIKALCEELKTDTSRAQKKIAQLYYLALLSNRALTPDEKKRFLDISLYLLQ